MLDDVSILNKFKELASDVEGFFDDRHATFWDILYSLQSELKISGNLMEIGVLHGRSAIMSILHSNPKTETVQLLDIELRDTLKTTLGKFTGELSDSIHTLIGDSKSFVTEEFKKNAENSYRWVHIDGEHTYNGVMSDLGNADRFLNAKGIICCDDFFNPRYTQITDAVFRYVYEHSDRICFFAIGHNKCYLCRPEQNRYYYDPLKANLTEYAKLRGQDITLFGGMVNGHYCAGIR